MRREIGWLMLAKLAALLILWALFFSPSHRLVVDGPVTAEQMALELASNPPSPSNASCGEQPCD